MEIYTYQVTVNTSGETDIIDLTPQVADLLRETHLKSGEVLLFVPGSTASITTMEYEDGLINDLRRAIEKIAPRGIPYDHDRRWGDGNGYSHVRAALLGPSLVVPFEEGRLLLGTWQQIILLDFDNRPRNRRILLRIRGV